LSDDTLLLALKRKRAILRARNDMIDFTRYVRPFPDKPDDVDFSLYEPVRHHKAVAAALEQVERGALPRLILVLPPRHGKTTLASHSFPAWFAGRNPQKSMIVTTYNEKFAWDFGRHVRGIMEDTPYSQIFPGTRLKSGAASVDRLEIEGGGGLFFVGRGSSVTGRGGDVLILDDPIKDRREADSQTIRDQCWLWFKQVLSSRLMTEKGSIIIIMTRWHEDDIVGRLTDRNSAYYSDEEAKSWRIISLPALAVGDSDPLGRQPGEALWPERFSAKYLQIQKRSDPRGFQALYQGSPSPEDGSFFRASHIKTYKTFREMPDKETMRFYAASDHATSVVQDRDKTCCMVVGVDLNDDIWVMPDLYWHHAPTDHVIEGMLIMIEKYKPTFWWAERGQITKSIGPFLRKRMIEKNVYCAIDQVVPIADKQSRAQSIQARMAMGRVHFPAYVNWWPAALDQLLKFPQGAHDDFVDTLAYIGLGLAKQVPRHVKRKPQEVNKFGTLGWIKNSTKKQERDEAYARIKEGW
jgi:predicted phage terminase large subunit-like protein